MGEHGQIGAEGAEEHHKPVRLRPGTKCVVMWPRNTSIQRRCATPAVKRKSGNMATMWARKGHTSGTGTGQLVRAATTAMATRASEAPTKSA